MPNKIVKKISAPLIIAPLFDTHTMKEFEKKQRNSREELQDIDQFITQYLLSRTVDFQRNDEAITV